MEGSGVPRLKFRLRVALALLWTAVAGVAGAGVAAESVKPSVRQDGAALAGTSARIDELTFDLGAATLRLHGVVATGAALSDGAFAALFDFADAAAFAAYMEAFSAASVTIEKIELAPQGAPADAPLVFRDVRLGDIKAGRIGSFAIPATTVERDANGAGEVKVKIGAIAGDALDLRVLAGFLASARDSELEPPRVFLRALRWEGGGLLAGGGATSVDIGAVSLNAVELRRPKTALSDIVRALKRFGDPSTKFAAAEAALLPDIFDLGACLQIGDFSLKDLRARLGEADKAGAFTLRQFVLRGFGG